MINWNEVKVGETEIEGKDVPTRWCILGIDDNQVWVKRVNRQYPESVYQIFSKQFIDETYNIYDPWGEITEECEWVCIDNTLMVYLIHYKGNALSLSDKCVKSDGRRVWKRKDTHT